MRDYQAYVGTASPFNFNGLVRHYYLRSRPQEADIQINLVAKDERKAQSHEIAQRIRPEMQEIARPYGANVKVLKCRLVRPSNRCWWQRSTDQTTDDRSPSRAMCERSSSPRRGC